MRATGPAAAVVTTSRVVYNDVSVTLRTMGMPTIYHLSPQQMIEAPLHWFWVLDGRVPGAAYLAHHLVKQGRTHGLFLAGRRDNHVGLLGAGVPAMLIHRSVELPEETRAPGLTPREVQVLQLSADGLSYAQVATKLGLSTLTVKSHLSRMAQKMGAGDRAHMVAIALRAGAIA